MAKEYLIYPHKPYSAIPCEECGHSLRFTKYLFRFGKLDCERCGFTCYGRYRAEDALREL